MGSRMQARTQLQSASHGSHACLNTVFAKQKSASSLHAGVEAGIEPELTSGFARSLDASVRSSFEPRFQQDFSRVRVHTDDRAASTATAANARAYTLGNNIFFNAGQYQPRSENGRRLLAHELTHVVQQKKGAFEAPSAPGNPSTEVEHEAARAELTVASTQPILVKSTANPRVPLFAPLTAATTQPDPREQIIDLAESNDAAHRQAALDLIVRTYFHPPASFAGITYDPNFVANRRRAHASVSPQHADTGGDFGGPQRISIGPHFFQHFRDRYAQRVRTIGHELQHVEQRSPSKTPGRRSLGSTILGGLAGAGIGAALGAAGLGIASLAGASISSGVLAGVLGAGAAIGAIVGAIFDPFRPGPQKKEPVKNNHTREFLSLHWAVTAEVPGLEQMEIGQRILTIEQPRAGALAEYKQMPPEDQKTYLQKYLELQSLLERLKRRQSEFERTGDFPGPEPPARHLSGTEAMV